MMVGSVSAWLRWAADDAIAFVGLQRDAAAHAALDLFGVSLAPSDLEDVFPSPAAAASVVATTRASTVVPRGVGGETNSWEQRLQAWSSQLWPPATLTKPRAKTVAPRRRHPIEAVVPSLPRAGYYVHIARDAAREIAGLWVARPSKEWSGLALVDEQPYGRGHARATVSELFWYNDAGGWGARDSGSATTIAARWEVKLRDNLLLRNRDADISRLLGHVHSHHGMGAFFSQTDVEMIGVRLDEQAACGLVSNGWLLSVVVGRGLTAAARLDGWERQKGSPIKYWTVAPVTVRVRWPKLVRFDDVLAAREEGYYGGRGSVGGEWAHYLHTTDGDL